MHPRTAYLIHGFNVKDKGASTIAKLVPYFMGAGFRVVPLSYLYTNLLRVRLCNRGLAYMLASMADAGSVAIGHSNGCAIIHLAAQFGAPFRDVVYINPALNKTAPLAKDVLSAHVWYSPSDKPVRFARFIPKHIWGEMGRTGYIGNDPRYHNYDKENDYLKDEFSSSEHSDVFEDTKLDFFGPRIVEAVVNQP